MQERKKTAKKKVYVCQVCNTYFTKDAEEPIPVCCAKGMIVMDEFEEGEVKEIKESAGGL
jgi:rubrerythrin